MKVEPFGLGYVHMHTYGCTHVDYASTYALTCNKTTANGTTLCALHGGDAQLLNIRVARLEDLVVDLENRVSQQPAANAPPPPPPEPIATAQQPVTSPEVAQQPSPAPLPPSPFGSFVNTSPFDSFSFGSFAWQPPPPKVPKYNFGKLATLEKQIASQKKQIDDLLERVAQLERRQQPAANAFAPMSSADPFTRAAFPLTVGLPSTSDAQVHADEEPVNDDEYFTPPGSEGGDDSDQV
jgi:hypothetical protein